MLGYVYLKDDGRDFKLGRTGRTVEERLADYHTENPRMRIVSYFKTDDPCGHEHELKGRTKDWETFGKEWRMRCWPVFECWMDYLEHLRFEGELNSFLMPPPYDERYFLEHQLRQEILETFNLESLKRLSAWQVPHHLGWKDAESLIHSQLESKGKDSPGLTSNDLGNAIYHWYQSGKSQL